MRLNEVDKFLLISQEREKRDKNKSPRELKKFLEKNPHDYYDGISAFYETDDDWCGSFKYKDKLYCRLHIGFCSPAKLLLKSSFWGNDDFGIEKLYLDYERAVADLQLIDELKTLNIDDLRSLDFKPF